ncbi:hypothetical protein X975_22478, partial [Stegodyphus mimosarum]
MILHKKEEWKKILDVLTRCQKMKILKQTILKNLRKFRNYMTHQ